MAVPMTESEVDIERLPARLRYIADKTEPGIQRAGLRIAASVIEGLLAERGKPDPLQEAARFGRYWNGKMTTDEVDMALASQLLRRIFG